MAPTTTVTGTPRPLSPDAEVTLLRVAQEALADVGRHARAGRVALTLSYMDGEAALGGRHPAGAPRARPRRGGADRPEIEVLELVARGSSNADVAARLFIRKTTVSAMERGIIALPAGKPDPEIPLGRVARRAGI